MQQDLCGASFVLMVQGLSFYREASTLFQDPMPRQRIVMVSKCTVKGMCLFRRIKANKRIAMHFDKRDRTFLSFIALALAKAYKLFC